MLAPKMRSSCPLFLNYVPNIYWNGHLMVGDLTHVHVSIFQTNKEMDLILLPLVSNENNFYLVKQINTHLNNILPI